jgi:hypothetical protein
MGWSVSAIFQQAMLNPIAGRCWSTVVPTSYGSLSADAINCALFGNSGTPNKADTLANTLYTAGQWTTTNEIATGGGYTQSGIALGSKAFAIDTGSSSICFTAANPSWTSATLSNVYGDFIYDTITTGSYLKQGLCYNYFGGAQGVTSGTFTVQWATPPSGGVTAVFNISV